MDHDGIEPHHSGCLQRIFMAVQDWLAAHVEGSIDKRWNSVQSPQAQEQRMQERVFHIILRDDLCADCPVVVQNSSEL